MTVNEGIKLAGDGVTAVGNANIGTVILIGVIAFVVFFAWVCYSTS